MGKSNIRKIIGIFILFTILGGLIGCGSKAKEEAAISMDEARLNISSAKKAGVSLVDPNLTQAQIKLRKAEKNYKKADYKSAAKESTDANKLALFAKKEKENQRNLKKEAVVKSMPKSKKAAKKQTTK